MDLTKYFRRIGFDHSSFVEPDLSTLKLIHKCHVMSVPFENLSIHCGEQVYMDLELIFDKIVNRSRGGWCFENNLLFGWVLRELGYDPTMLGSRVFSNSLEDFSPFDNHLINKVVVEGTEYIADVSFGVSKQLWEPLELVSGKDQTQAAGVFRLFHKDGVWILEKTGRKPEVLRPSSLVNTKRTKPMYCFTLEPRSGAYFSEASHRLQTDPSSLFTNKSICSLQTSTGFKALVGRTYSRVTYRPDEGVDVFDMRSPADDDEVEQILREEFNIRLEKKLEPADKSLRYTL